jgi:hypothetical protein
MKAGEHLEVTIREYRSALAGIAESGGSKTDDVPWELVETRLTNDHGWTREGAEQIVRLAREYGAFMLRNALALAGVFEIKDGELGY